KFSPARGPTRANEGPHLPTRVLRRVMRDVRPPGDQRQSGARTRHVNAFRWIRIGTYSYDLHGLPTVRARQPSMAGRRYLRCSTRTVGIKAQMSPEAIATRLFPRTP